MIDLTQSVLVALVLFACLCSIGALITAAVVAAKLVAIQNTEYKFIPVEQKTSGLEKLEEQIKEAQESLKDNFNSVGLDPEDLV